MLRERSQSQKAISCVFPLAETDPDKQSRLVVTRVPGGWGEWGVIANGYGISFGG